VVVLGNIAQHNERNVKIFYPRMWTATTRLHILNAISRYGLRKPSFIGAYLRVCSKDTPCNWKDEYNKMVKEYLRYKNPIESVKEYFQRKRKEVIENMIEKRKQEKTKIIERMIFGYDNIEDSDEESDEIASQKTEEVSAEIAAIAETNISSAYGLKSPAAPLIATLFQLSSLGNLPPHLALPGLKQEPSSAAPELTREDEDSFTEQSQVKITPQEQELEEILNTLENSGYGISVSSIDSAAFERFFKWTVEKTSYLDSKKKELEEKERREHEEVQNKTQNELQDGEASPSVYSLKEYYSLDFHEYPRKRSPKDKAKWISDFFLIISRLKGINSGAITCEAHTDTKQKENAEDQKRGRKKIACIKCFNAEVLEEELEKDYRPILADYVFRAMLFLQTVIFTKYETISPKEIDLVKNELYKFYEYYRK